MFFDITWRDTRNSITITISLEGNDDLQWDLYENRLCNEYFSIVFEESIVITNRLGFGSFKNLKLKKCKKKIWRNYGEIVFEGTKPLCYVKIAREGEPHAYISNFKLDNQMLFANCRVDANENEKFGKLSLDKIDLKKDLIGQNNSINNQNIDSNEHDNMKSNLAKKEKFFERCDAFDEFATDEQKNEKQRNKTKTIPNTKKNVEQKDMLDIISDLNEDHHSKNKNTLDNHEKLDMQNKNTIQSNSTEENDEGIVNDSSNGYELNFQNLSNNKLEQPDKMLKNLHLKNKKLLKNKINNKFDAKSVSNLDDSKLCSKNTVDEKNKNNIEKMNIDMKSQEKNNKKNKIINSKEHKPSDKTKLDKNDIYKKSPIKSDKDSCKKNMECKILSRNTQEPLYNNNYSKYYESCSDDNEEDPNKLETLFYNFYKNANEDSRRAMNKSFIESEGTVLSSCWKDVGFERVKVEGNEDTHATNQREESSNPNAEYPTSVINEKLIKDILDQQSKKK
ncbi:Cochaperone protein [Conglomerata obtusa]